MTDLLIDIGNSRIKWAVAEAGALRGASRAVAHDAMDTLWAEWSRLAAPPARIRMTDVARPVIGERLAEWMNATWDAAPESIRTPRIGGGVTVAYPQPEQLGTDRWLGMVGARAAGYAPACIVDCGSAITVDVVDASGRHQGGLILAGLAAQQAGMAQTAPGLPAVTLPTRAALLATNTPDALISGYLQGTASAVQGIVRASIQQTGERLTPVLTGGDAPLIARYLDIDVRLRPDLVLEGLARLP